MLIEDTKHHFSSEEALLESWDYLEIEKHKEIHHNLLDDAYALREEIEKGHLSYRDVMNFFLNDLVIHHIVEEDRKYFHQV